MLHGLANKRSVLLSILVLLISAFPVSSRAPIPQARVLQEVRSHLEKPEGLALDVRAQATALKRYYDSSTAGTFWTESGRTDQLIEALEAVQLSGLTRTDRWVKRLRFMEQSLRAQDARFAALAELTFSAALLQIVSDLRLGKFQRYKKLLHPRTLARRVIENPALEALQDGFSLSEVLDAVQPSDIDYQAMKSRLGEYVALRRRGGWPLVRVGPQLKVGDSGRDVQDLRRRLAASGELALPLAAGDQYDVALQNAVKLFQRRHGLATTGTVGRRTQLAMNVPVETRIRQLQVNLERWRWFALPQGGPRWIINTAAQRIFVQQGQAEFREVRIVATHACQDAAAFDTALDGLTFYPEYRVSSDAAARYVLPLLKKNAGSLGENIKVEPQQALRAIPAVFRPDWIDWKNYSENDFPFDVTIEPGPANPLGAFKLSLGEIDSISIHGQPRKKLPFRQGLSCVALRKSENNLKVLLPGLTGDFPQYRKDDTASHAPIQVNLPRLPSVVFIYATVWLDAGGELIFGPDPLGKDAKLNRAL